MMNDDINSEPEMDAERYVKEVSAFLGLVIPQSDLKAIGEQVELNRSFARILLDFEYPPHS